MDYTLGVKTKYTLFIDSECSFCALWVERIVRFLGISKKIEVRAIAYATDPSGPAQYMRRYKSWALLIDDIWFNRFGVFPELVSQSPWLGWSAWFYRLSPIRFIGEKIYTLVSTKKSCPLKK